jgi:hypothetical protein
MNSSKFTLLSIAFVTAAPLVASQSCPDYSVYSTQHNEPLSNGSFQLSYQRPADECRTFNSSDVEDTIARLRNKIKDPDLFRLFENSCTHPCYRYSPID